MSSEPRPLHNRRATDPKSAVLADALSYESALPMSWTPLAVLPDSATLERYNEDNLRALAAVALLDEQRSGGSGSSEDANGLEGEIARLNQKMNLLVDLVSFLVGQQAPAPEATAVRLSWQGIAWRGTGTIGNGLVNLRLHRSVPQPFSWPARVIVADGGEVYARFEPMSEPCQTALERHVFLHHRRSIAGTRRPAA
jgi:hypothetical protein